MKIFLDFDRTLIDSSRLCHEVCGELYHHHDVFRKTQPFTVVGFCQYVTDQGLDGERLRQQFYERAGQAEQYVFPDAVDFLQALRQANHQPILLTFSPEIDDWQKPKIASSGLLPFLDDVHVTADDKVAIVQSLRLTEPFVFIDDKQSEIDAMQNAFPKSLCIKHEVGAPLLEHLDHIAAFVNKQ